MLLKDTKYIDKYMDLIEEFFNAKNKKYSTYEYGNCLFNYDIFMIDIFLDIKCPYCNSIQRISCDQMCPNCKGYYLLYPNIGVDYQIEKLDFIINDVKSTTNFGSWDWSELYKITIDDNYYCCMHYAAYYDPNSGITSESYWKQPNDWYKLTVFVFDDSNMRNKYFDDMMNTEDLHKFIKKIKEQQNN